MIREIPEGSVEIQTGLWLYEYQRTIGGREYTFRQLYSAEGYCFYNMQTPENFDEEGNLLPPEERLYVQFAQLAISMSSWTYEQLGEVFISVPVQDGYYIANVDVPNITI